MADRDSQSMGNNRPLTPYSMTYRYGTGAGGIVTGTQADWFGPLNPMSPIAPADVKGRILDYPSGYNLNIRPRAYEAISFEMLRAFADNYDLLRLLIETRKDQMSRLSWNIVPRDKAMRKRGAKVPGAIESRIKKVEEFFLRPDQENFWGDWLRMLLEDLFVIDAPTLYRRRTVGGELYGLQPLDGGTIKRVIDNWGHTPMPPSPAYQQVLKGYPAVDYTTEEVIYKPRNKRTNKIYGYSPVEQIVMTINIGMRRQTWQLQSFTEGNVPEALIGTPMTWTPDQIAQFQTWFDSMLEGNTGERRRARFVPGEIAKGYVATKPSELFGQAEEWIVRVMCFAFNISPQPFVNMMNRATAETAQETAVSEGLAPIQNWVKTLMDGILIDDFKSPDLEFVFLDEDELDPDKRSTIVEREHASGRLTFNEARREMGDDPIDHPDADRPMMKTASGWVPLFLSPEEQAEKDAMAAQISGEGVPPGDDQGSPSDEEQDDGTKVPGDAGTDEGAAEKADVLKSEQPREPSGSSKGGQFASKNAADLFKGGITETTRGNIYDKEAPEFNSKVHMSKEELNDWAVGMHDALPDTKLTMLMEHVSLGDYHATEVTIKGNGVKMVRTFKKNEDGSISVSHDDFFLNAKYQGQGHAKKVMSNSIDDYEKMGVSDITTNANADLGGYVWAKAGFQLYNQPSETGLRDYVDGRLKGRKQAWTRDAKGTKDLRTTFSKEELDSVRSHIKSMAPGGDLPARIADLRINGKHIGKELLMGAGWSAKLTLDAAGKQRVRDFIKGGK